MKVGIVAIPRVFTAGDTTPVIDQLIDLARNVEQLGFEGLWVTDSFARGSRTLDPMALLGTLAAVTERIELGTCVVQIPLRHPVEHAHRVQTVNLLSKGRLRFGVGSGSTKADFDAVQVDYEARFKLLPAYLEVMRRTWQGEGVYGDPLSLWPGTEGGPPVMLGAWRSQRWINLAANHCQGWIASGIHGSWDDLELGVKMYRAAGGKRALLANVFTDLRPEPAPIGIRHEPKITLRCSPAEAKERLARIAELGLDDVLLVVSSTETGYLEQIRALF
ncbi:MAG: LLM class flavin-dependent oxidoreductase [Gammaproteobacteria bacterium]|nr:LLM class flavin-dependent oxidoreductase [Gammaproteobacteria bacterium]